MRRFTIAFLAAVLAAGAAPAQTVPGPPAAPTPAPTPAPAASPGGSTPAARPEWQLGWIVEAHLLNAGAIGEKVATWVSRKLILDSKEIRSRGNLGRLLAGIGSGYLEVKETGRHLFQLKLTVVPEPGYIAGLCNASLSLEGEEIASLSVVETSFEPPMPRDAIGYAELEPGRYAVQLKSFCQPAPGIGGGEKGVPRVQVEFTWRPPTAPEIMPVSLAYQPKDAPGDAGTIKPSVPK